MATRVRPTSPLRMGLVGLGNMGSFHAENIVEGRIPECVLSAVCDVEPSKLSRWKEASHFQEAGELFRSGLVDAVLIATPHPSHAPLGRDAFRAGLPVLMEKPVAVHKAEAERLIAGSHGLPFAMMFNQRTDPFFQKVRELIQGGTLGKVRRFTWTITDWFRTNAYYRSSPWRATWVGEGGGVLLNQAVHNMDLLQWIFGLPSRVIARCVFGKHHPIEVEDEVHALLDYEDGKSGVFITSSGEVPGINRLEVAGDRGLLVLNGENLRFTRTEVPVDQFTRECPAAYHKPAVWEAEIPLPGARGPQHAGILRNFVSALLHGEPLIAPGPEGLASLELTNAILLSSLESRPVDLPLNAARFSRALKTLQSTSR